MERETDRSGAALHPGGFVLAPRGDTGPYRLRLEPHSAAGARSVHDRVFRVAARIPPGIWEGETTRVDVLVDGRPIGCWRREDLVPQIVALLAAPDAAQGLAALDLARQSGLHALLPADVTARLTEVAARFGLEDLLPIAAIPAPAPPVTEDEADQLREAYEAARQADPARDPVAIFDALIPAGRTDPWLPLTLAEDMRRAGRLEAYAARILSRGIALPSPVAGNDWTNLSLLPFLIAAGDEAGTDSALWYLEHARGGWLLAGLLGWTGEVLASRARLSDRAAQRFAQWLRILEVEARDPWGNAFHRDLIASVARLAGRRAMLAPEQAAALADTALRCYALSPGFWAALRRDAPDPGPRLAAGARAFADLHGEALAPGSGTPAAWAALVHLHAAGVHGLDAFRFEVPSLAVPGAWESGEARLRWLAAPPGTRPAERIAPEHRNSPDPAPTGLMVAVLTTAEEAAPRIAALRAAWLDRAEAAGVSWIAVQAGDGDGLAERHLTLAAEAGEGATLLPGLLSWALSNGVRRLCIVADRTDLDPAWLVSVAREAGITGFPCDLPADFRHPRRNGGRIDLSPGGTGVALGLGLVLDDAAMRALLAAAATPGGQMLVAGTQNADRLIAALAALAGIGVRDPGLDPLLCRAPEGGGLPVPVAGREGFTPGTASRSPACWPQGDRSDGRLMPPRIWPATRPAGPGAGGHAMILVAGAAQLPRIRDAAVAVGAVLRNERAMLPHFLDHYRRLGAGGFLMVDNGSDDGSTDYLAAQPDVALFAAATPFRAAVQGTEWKRALMAQLRPGRWTLVADLDEFLVSPGLRGPAHPQGWQGGPDLPALVAGAEAQGHDAFRILMLDLYPEGPLSAAALDRNPFDAAPMADRQPWRSYGQDFGPYGDRNALRSALRHRLLPGSPPDMFVSEKVALFRHRPWMRHSVSLHYAAEVEVAPTPLVFAHFKYTADLHLRIAREIRRGQYFNNAAEYRRYATVLGQGTETIHDPGISVHWTGVLPPDR